MDTKISQDPLISSFDGTEFFPLVQAGANKRALVGQLWTLNETTIASGIGSQASSQVLNFRMSLWNGSSETKGWWSWRADASLTNGLDNSLGLYYSIGSSPTLGTPILLIRQSQTVQPYLQIGNGVSNPKTTNIALNLQGIGGTGALAIEESTTDISLGAQIYLRRGRANNAYLDTGVIGKVQYDAKFNSTTFREVANFRTVAVADHSSSNGGTKFVWSVTKSGTTTLYDAMTLTDDGVINLSAANTHTTWAVGDFGVGPGLGSGSLLKVGIQGTTSGGYIANWRSDPTTGGVQNLVMIDAGTGSSGGLAVAGGIIYYTTDVLHHRHLSMNSAGTAINAATQKNSFTLEFQTTLWNGSAAIPGFWDWRADVNTSVNSEHALTLYEGKNGQPFNNPVFELRQLSTTNTATFTGLSQRVVAKSSNNQPAYFGFNDQSSSTIQGGTFITFSSGEVAHYANASYYTTLYANNVLVMTIKAGPSASTYNGAAWTALANNDYHFAWGGNLTGRPSQAGDTLFGYKYTLTMNTGTNGQTLYGVYIAPAFNGTGTFWALGVAGNMMFDSSGPQIRLGQNGPYIVGNFSGTGFIGIMSNTFTPRIVVKPDSSFWLDANINLAWSTAVNATVPDIGITRSAAGLLIVNDGTGTVRANITFANLVVDTVTGSMLGTATNQKLGLWGKAPIVQPTTAITGATRVAGAGTAVLVDDTYDGYTMAKFVAAVRATGLVA